MLNLATESTYIFQSHFNKQTDSCTTDGPLSVNFSNICLTKLEKDQVKPIQPKLSCRFVDGVRSARLMKTHDSLFDNLNNDHKKAKFIIEINPLKFLDTILLLENGIIKILSYRRAKEYSVHWKSQIPTRY